MYEHGARVCLDLAGLIGYINVILGGETQDHVGGVVQREVWKLASN